MKKYFFLLCLLGFMGLTFAIEASHAQQGCGFSYKREFEEPDAFEKFYVTGNDILYTPEGIFLKRSCGCLEKVRALSHDCKGMYVLRVYTQCPLCGRVYTGRASPEGFDCPLYEQEVVPGIWE